MSMNEALDLAMKAFQKEFGEGALLDEGDEVVFEFNNCVLIMGLEDNKLKIKFIGGTPLKVNYSVSIFEG